VASPSRPQVDRPLIGLTAGDPAGIGPEIVVKALCEPAMQLLVRPLVFADRAVLEQASRLLGLDVELHAVTSAAAGRYTPGVLDFVDVGALAEPIPYGRVSAAGGRAGMAYLERAVAAALDGQILGLVTAPLNKESLQAAGSPFIDHTAMLAARAARHVPMTAFMVKTLRIFFLTRHLAFADIPAAITAAAIGEALPLCDLYLRQLGIERPRVAVAALNPHGGEQGLFGREEMEVIGPAVARARAAGRDVGGPVPADAVFHQCLAGKYDGVLCLYHDQGHIAAKTLDFHGTVSLTMGLRFLRTSVDHGTAFDIAGQGKADGRAMVAAIETAGKYASIVRRRVDLEAPG
jgi:4-phospho-D-threonate 3-dehydrogenase / 4-phospho-D-erythronate 3-dehydrogenase